MEEIKTWCEERKSAPDYEDNSALGGAINYYLDHYDRLIAFCHISGVQIDNNLVEMVLKLIVLGRKNALFYKTLEGAQVGDVMTSLIATGTVSGFLRHNARNTGQF